MHFYRTSSLRVILLRSSILESGLFISGCILMELVDICG